MKTNTTGLIATLGALVLAGCQATTTPNIDARFGEAETLLKAQQTLNPDASRNTNPVSGMDGIAAKGALYRYRKAMGPEAPAEARSPSTVINSNSSAGGQ